ncbi:MAG: signal recognition particle-docking protein FtsY, partial [Candidatus Thermoplasmatota archaeon]|jgi:fused signal recognition particle receptor|nr:signal recognition particle-docking protein FtsY [Candidatus Thermoplasmatota archaeon]MDP7266144.1 signal recognition particle-docking protein FtsY [Candidatus Thermoplasmatota archaeon]
MFNSLKKKLKGFLTKASKDLGEDKKNGKPPSIKKKPKGDLDPFKRKMRVKRRREEEKVEESKWSRMEKTDILSGVEGGFSGKKINKKKLDSVIWELEIALYESDVATSVVEEIKNKLKSEIEGVRIRRGLSLEKVITRALKNAISNVLAIDPYDFDRVIAESKRPIIMMFVGVNGTGKTTSIAKIVHRLHKNNYSCVVAACDTFRAGAIEQLQKHADKLNVKLVKQGAGADPAAIAFDAVEHARARNKDVVLIDTAGRMHSNANLMSEMAKLKRVAKPDVIIFVGDALAGNDAVEQAMKFEECVGIDAAILSKIDADAKGGAALSIAHAVGKPIMFVGVGQEYKDLQEFNPHWMLKRLFN